MQQTLGSDSRSGSDAGQIENDESANAGGYDALDDGEGIGSLPADTTGMGLKIMRYRAELIGGSMSIGPAEGSGTLVSCVLRTSLKNGESKEKS